jgi:hypothetical protein
MMKHIGWALCLATAGTLNLAAQSNDTSSKTKITIKDGKDVEVTGCVAPGVTAGTYVLTNVADKRGAMHNYLLIANDNKDLAKHVGHRVEIEGKVTDRGDDVKVKIETETKTETPRGDRKTESTSELKGETVALPYLGVQEIEMIAAVCP